MFSCIHFSFSKITKMWFTSAHFTERLNWISRYRVESHVDTKLVFTHNVSSGQRHWRSAYRLSSVHQGGMYRDYVVRRSNKVRHGTLTRELINPPCNPEETRLGSRSPGSITRNQKYAKHPGNLRRRHRESQWEIG